MRRNLLVKGEGNLLGRKTSLCQGTKDPGVFKDAFKDVKGGAVSRADAESWGKRKRSLEEIVGNRAVLGRSE